MKRFWTNLCVVTLCVLSTGCITLLSLPGMLEVKESQPFVIAESSAPMGWGYYSHPVVNEPLEGNIVVYYYVGGDQLDPLATDEMTNASPAVSCDGGKTWAYGDDKTAAGLRHPQRDNANRAFVVIEMADGAIWYNPVLTKDTKRVASTVWIEGGVVVEGPSDVPLSQSIGFYPRGVELPNGELLNVGYSTKYKAEDSVRCRAILSRSGDKGRTWSVEPLAKGKDCPWGNEGPNESSVILLPDNELLCLIRTGAERGYVGVSGRDLLEARSKDFGKTWSYRRMNIKGVYPKLLLMSNGVLVLATGRPGNVLYFSLDGGRSWGHEINLTAADVKTTGYCDIIEVEPGRLLAVFDMFDTDASGLWLWEPREVNGIYGCYVDVRRHAN